MHSYSFEKLEVWRAAKDLVKQVYTLTKQFPSEERFGLTSQINRAVVSVASAIAEGTARVSRKDQAHFSQIAYGSLMEAACQLLIAVDLGYLTSKDSETIRMRIEEISNKLNALQRYQLRSYQLNGSAMQSPNRQRKTIS